MVISKRRAVIVSIVVFLSLSNLVSADSLEVANVTLYLVGQCKQAIPPEDGLPYDNLNTRRPPCSYYKLPESALSSLNDSISRWNHTVEGSFRNNKPNIFRVCESHTPFFKTKNPDTEVYYDGVWLVIVKELNKDWLDLKQLRELVDGEIEKIEDNLFENEAERSYLGCSFKKARTLKITHAKNFRPENLTNTSEVKIGLINTTFEGEMAAFLATVPRKLRVHVNPTNTYSAYEFPYQGDDPYPSKYPRRILILASRDITHWGSFMSILCYLDWKRESEVMWKSQRIGLIDDPEEYIPLFEITQDIQDDIDEFEDKYKKLKNDIRLNKDNASKRLEYVDNFSSYLSDVFFEIRDYTGKLKERRPTSEERRFTDRLNYVLHEEDDDNPAYAMFFPALNNSYHNFDTGYEMAEIELEDYSKLYAEMSNFIFFERDYLQGIIESERWKDEFDEIKRSREDAWWFNILSICAVVFSIIVVSVVGWYTIKEQGKSTIEQIRELRAVGSKIQESGDQQIQTFRYLGEQQITTLKGLEEEIQLTGAQQIENLQKIGETIRYTANDIAKLTEITGRQINEMKRRELADRD